MKLIFGQRKLIEKRASNLIAKKILKLSKMQDKIIMGVAGGRTIPNILKNLQKTKIPWEKVHLFMVDERIVPITNKESNFNSIKTIHEYFPKENLHPYNQKEKASKYYLELKKFGGTFDIILLSSGEDGHIASLFPNHPSIKNIKPGFIEINDSPKYPSKRISASVSLIRKSNFSILLFIGNNKKEAYEKFINPDIKVISLPAKIVNTIKESYILTDIQN